MRRAAEQQQTRRLGGIIAQLAGTLRAAAGDLIRRIKPRRQRWQVMNLRTGEKRRM